jgi:hypothetical protein
MPTHIFRSMFALIPFLMMAGYIALAIIFMLLFYRFVCAVEKIAGKIHDSSKI